MRLILISDVVFVKKEAQIIHVLELFNNLRKVADVSLFVPKPPKIDYDLSNVKYVPRLAIPLIGLISYQISLFFSLYFYCKKNKVDAIYARQSNYTFMPVIISKYFKIPYFVEVNGLITDEIKLLGLSKLLTIITKISEKLSYKQAKKIVAVTQGIKDGIMDLYNISDEKIVVIGNGANTELFRPINQDSARKKLQLDPGVKYICFAGHLVSWQGIEYLIQAAPDILARCPNTHFLIVGEGSMKDELIQYVQKLGVCNNFTFTGTVPYDKVPLYINASDICIVTKKPLKSGFSPLKLYEYMACSKPIIATQTDGFEILKKCNGGILINPTDTHEFVDTAVKLLQTENLRKQMGSNGREYVVKNHSWASVARKVAKVCENVIQGHNGTNN